MCYNKLPEKVRLKVLDYYEYRYHGKMFDEGQIFSEVSQNLHEVSHPCDVIPDNFSIFLFLFLRACAIKYIVFDSIPAGLIK